MPESFLAKLRDNPATQGLIDSATGFAAAKISSIGQPKSKHEKHGFFGLGGGGGDEDDSDAKSSSDDEGGVGLMDRLKGGAMEGAGEAMGSGKSKIFGGIAGALKGLFKKGGSAKRPTNIYESLFIGVPVEQAYANWTEYSKFPEFMKGPESVKVNKEEGEDGEVKETHQWTAKIFLNRRSWKATVEEDVENSRIRWSTEAAKGTIDGAISFTPIGDNATLMVYTLEYRPKGFFEWWGNRWRTVGRRARLDVKHFGRYVMMQDQTQDAEDENEPEVDEPDELDTPDDVDAEDGISEDVEPGEDDVVVEEQPADDDDDEITTDDESDVDVTPDDADDAESESADSDDGEPTEPGEAGGTGEAGSDEAEPERRSGRSERQPRQQRAERSQREGRQPRG